MCPRNSDVSDAEYAAGRRNGNDDAEERDEFGTNLSGGYGYDHLAYYHGYRDGYAGTESAASSCGD